VEVEVVIIIMKIGEVQIEGKEKESHASLESQERAVKICADK